MVAVAHYCTALEHFKSSGFYAVNILREEQLDLSIRFAQLPEGRFTGVAWREGATGAPLLEGVLGMLECRTIESVDLGDHRVLIGEAVAAEAAEGRPLVFFESGYTRLE